MHSELIISYFKKIVLLVKKNNTLKKNVFFYEIPINLIYYLVKQLLNLLIDFDKSFQNNNNCTNND